MYVCIYVCNNTLIIGWLGSRVVSVLDSVYVQCKLTTDKCQAVVRLGGTTQRSQAARSHVPCQAGTARRRSVRWTARVQIAVATLSGYSLRQTVHTHCASVHQAAKLVAALLRVVGVTAGLAESNGSLPPGLWLTPPAGRLPRTGISFGTLRTVIEYGLPFNMDGPLYRRSVFMHDWAL